MSKVFELQLARLTTDLAYVFHWRPPCLGVSYLISSLVILQTLTQQELDMVKLMFSLMDTDGRLTLTTDKLSRFVLNILGASLNCGLGSC